MNINLLTIDSNLTGITGTSPFPSKPDLKTEGIQFDLTLEDKKQQVGTIQNITSDNIKGKAQNNNKLINILPQGLQQLIDIIAKSENTFTVDNKTKPKEQNATIDSALQQNKQPNIIQIWLSENFITVEQNNEGIPKNIEDKFGHQLTQIIATQHNDNSIPVTGHTVKSEQIKLLHTLEKGQSGIKTILPTKSMSPNGLKTITSDTSKSIPAGMIQIETQNNKEVPVSTKTIAEIKSTTEKGITKELAPGISDNVGENTNRTGVKPPSVNIKSTILPDKTSEKQSQHSNIDPGKPILTAKTDNNANTLQNISNLSNPSKKEAIPASNNLLENQSGQKINITAVQVTNGQTKEQSNSASNKGSSQSFEQMLSQTNSHILVTEPPVSAKNATKASSMGRSSSSEVSADIGKQILESVQKSISQQDNDHQITVRLNPPELGKVLIRFQQQDAEIIGHMEVNKPQTRLEIEQALPQIIRNLADCGIQIKRIEVILSNEQQSGQGSLGNQSLQSGGDQQHYSRNPGTAGNNTDVYESNEWFTGNNSYENLFELQRALVTDNSINLLI